MKNRCIIIIALLLSMSMHAQIIPNASFEDWPDSCSVDQAPIGWTNWSTSVGAPDQRGPNCIGNIPAYHGTNFMCLRWVAGGPNFEEGVATNISGLTIGETYKISFYTRPDDYWAYGEEIFFYFYQDSVLFDMSQPIPSGSDWQEVFFHITATDTIHQIAFRATDGGGTSSFSALVVDNMSISNALGLTENNLEERKLVRIVDFMGQETEDKANTLLIHMYNDGTTEKVYRIE